jgi:hypothetical protein
MGRDKKRDELNERIFQALIPYNKNVFGKQILTERYNYLHEVMKGIPSGGKTVFTLEDCAEVIIIQYKINIDGGYLGLYDPNKIENEYRDILKDFDKIENKINKLPPFSQRFMGEYFIKNNKNYLKKAKEGINPLEHMCNKIRKVSDEFSDFTSEHHTDLWKGKVDLKVNSIESIVIVEASMGIWKRRLRKITKPKKLRRYSKLYDYLKDIFDAFGCTSDVETAYNNWRKI